MEVYVLDQIDPLVLGATARWRKESISIEDAFIKYAGKKTFQVWWEVDGLKYCSTIRSYGDELVLGEILSEKVNGKNKKVIRQVII